MATRKRKRLHLLLDEFPPAELDALLADYLRIRSQVEHVREMDVSAVSMPLTKSREEQLAALRDLDSKGDLRITISRAGNLNVWVRTPGLGEPEEDGDTYVTVLTRPTSVPRK